MVISHNVTAMNAARQVNISVRKKTKSAEKLSSGYRINRAADDASGLSVSEKMRLQMRGLHRASENCTDGISLVQTADGAMDEIHSTLQRMNELTIQAANDTNSPADRAAIQNEIDALVDEIGRVSSTTTFNDLHLLDGSFKEKTVQAGNRPNEFIPISIESTAPETLNLTAGTETYTLGNDVEATVTASGAFTAEVTNPAKVPDTTLFYSSYYPDKSIPITSGIGLGSAAVTLTSQGAESIAKESNPQYYFYLTAGTQYLATPTPTIPASGWYQLKNKNGNPITNSSQIGTSRVALASDVSSFLNINSGTPNNKGLAVVNPTAVQSAGKTSGWAEREGGTSTGAITATYDSANLSDAMGISVQGSPAVGDMLTLTAFQKAGTYTKSYDRLKVDSYADALDAMARVQKAIETVSSRRAYLGATQNRLEHTVKNLDNVVENTTAAESRIRDTDMAKEMVSYAASSILEQSGESMLSQANQTPQSVLQLLS